MTRDVTLAGETRDTVIKANSIAGILESLLIFLWAIVANETWLQCIIPLGGSLLTKVDMPLGVTCWKMLENQESAGYTFLPFVFSSFKLLLCVIQIDYNSFGTSCTSIKLKVPSVGNNHITKRLNGNELPSTHSSCQSGISIHFGQLQDGTSSDDLIYLHVGLMSIDTALGNLTFALSYSFIW